MLDLHAEEVFSRQVVSFTVPGTPAPPSLPRVHITAISVDGATKRLERDLRRFFAKVDLVAEAPCWLWVGARTEKGYGTFGFGERRAVGGMPAHRASYQLFVGPIPKGLVLDHLCRNRACVNPQHLEPVTDQINVLRGEGPAAHAARRTHCDHGHEFTPENTIWRTDRSRPARRCRTCTLARGRRRYHAQRGQPCPR